MILTECGKWALRRRRLAVPGQQWGLNVGGAKFEVPSTFEVAFHFSTQDQLQLQL